MAKRQTTTKPISDSLKGAMAASGLSVYRIAKDTGISQPALQRFVSGQRGITLDTADKLATYFKLKLTE
jgi:plasmid maintenance system antidote protein VapI